MTLVETGMTSRHSFDTSGPNPQPPLSPFQSPRSSHSCQLVGWSQYGQHPGQPAGEFGILVESITDRVCADHHPQRWDLSHNRGDCVKRPIYNRSVPDALGCQVDCRKGWVALLTFVLPCLCRTSRWAQQDSNLRPADYESGFGLSAAVRNPPICRTFLFWLSARIHHFPPQLLPGLLPFSTDRCTIGRPTWGLTRAAPSITQDFPDNSSLTCSGTSNALESI